MTTDDAGVADGGGPDVGDEVEITVRGRVIARARRNGVDSVHVEIPGSLTPAWRSVADEVVVVERASSR